MTFTRVPRAMSSAKTCDKTMRLRARDLDGNDIDQVETGYIARVWQHEFDHLNGTLITDRMGAVAKMTARKTLRELEDKYAAMHGKKGPPDKKRM